MSFIDSLESVTGCADFIEDINDLLLAPGGAATHRPLAESGDILHPLLDSSMIATAACHRSPPDLRTLFTAAGIIQGRGLDGNRWRRRYRQAG